MLLLQWLVQLKCHFSIWNIIIEKGGPQTQTSRKCKDTLLWWTQTSIVKCGIHCVRFWSEYAWHEHNNWKQCIMVLLVESMNRSVGILSLNISLSVQQNKYKVNLTYNFHNKKMFRHGQQNPQQKGLLIHISFFFRVRNFKLHISMVNYLSGKCIGIW